MEIIVAVIILIFSAILHEVMHGFAAEKLGDPTARVAGRLTLNPIPHIDPMMSILIPLLLIISGSPIVFGAAKPVPVNPSYFKEGRKDLALVALAGPLTNISLAVVASVIFRILFPHLSLIGSVGQVLGGVFVASSLPSIIVLILIVTIYINLILGIINLIPIPPVDGSKIFSIILPNELALLYFSLEPFGIFILLFLLLMPIGGFSLPHLINQFLLAALRFLGS